MTDYETIMHDAVRNVIAKCGDRLTKPEIRKFVRDEFRELSTTYSMRDVRNDSLMAFSNIVRGLPWSPDRKVLTHAEILAIGIRKTEQHNRDKPA